MGDEVNCTIAKLEPLKADAEEIPLDITYEDDHVLVVNKPPHMVRNLMSCSVGGHSDTLSNTFVYRKHRSAGPALQSFTVKFMNV